MTNNVAQEAIASQIEKIVKEHVGTDEELPTQTHLQDDLDIDSLERVELGIKLEKAFGITLANEQIRNLVTLGDCVDLVARQINLKKGEGYRT